VSGGSIGSQDDAVRLLGRRGYPVSQATVSRDLAAIGAGKRGDPDGEERYVLRRAGVPETGLDDLARMLREFVVGIDHSGNLALIRTEPGSAGPVASAVDRAAPDGVLGTVAGDDTVLVVARTARGGAGLARRLQQLWEGTR